MYKKSAEIKKADKHIANVAALIFHSGKLYSGGNDGKIKVWNSELQLEATIDAHPVNVYDISASEKYFYSCSNDGTIKAWDICTNNHVQTLMENADDEITKLFYYKDRLYSGDNKGHVRVFEKHELVVQYDTMEEICGICVKDNYLFTTGTLDVILTELKPGIKSLYTLHKTENGRDPMCFAGKNVCFLNRDGRCISIIDSNPGSLEGHQLMINSVCGNVEATTLYSGGYYKFVKIWDVQLLKDISSVDIGKTVDAIAIDNNKQVFIATDDGSIQRLTLL